MADNRDASRKDRYIRLLGELNIRLVAFEAEMLDRFPHSTFATVLDRRLGRGPRAYWLKGRDSPPSENGPQEPGLYRALFVSGERKFIRLFELPPAARATASMDARDIFREFDQRAMSEEEDIDKAIGVLDSILREIRSKTP